MLRKIKNIAHGYEAELAAFFYGKPARKIKTIGVTGTDGKTTTSSLIYHILKESGMHPAMITTVGAQMNDKTYETGLHTTTPSAFTLQKYIKKAVDEKCDYLVLEVTSHALDQNRVHGVDFQIGVLTNITHEHLDYHKTYENYVLAKSKLFNLSRVAIINKDDESYNYINKLLKNSEIKTYSVNSAADFSLKNIGLKFPKQFQFNYENFMAAVSVAKMLNIPDEKIQMALTTFRFPEGRQEIVYDEEFQVIVDFAHTPNSFAKILPSLKSSSKRLIHVFGSAGERDKSKRPLMGEISCANADIVILTSEDPRTEKVSEINNDIKMGFTQEFKKGKGLYEIEDRKEAIEKALKLAQKGDIVVITGKGHEKSMNMGNGEVPWSDRETIVSALKK